MTNAILNKTRERVKTYGERIKLFVKDAERSVGRAPLDVIVDGERDELDGRLEVGLRHGRVVHVDGRAAVGALVLVATAIWRDCVVALALVELGLALVDIRFGQKQRACYWVVGWHTVCILRVKIGYVRHTGVGVL